jgi:hypothetical protein
MISVLLLNASHAAFASHRTPDIVSSGFRVAPDTSGVEELLTLPLRFTNKSKFTLKERVALKLVKGRVGKFLAQKGEASPRQKRLGKLSLYFGIAAFAVVLIPVVNILSLPAAITAVILGIISLKGNSNINGIIGASLGGLFFLLLILLVLILIAAFGGW